MLSSARHWGLFGKKVEEEVNAEPCTIVDELENSSAKSDKSSDSWSLKNSSTSDSEEEEQNGSAMVVKQRRGSVSSAASSTQSSTISSSSSADLNLDQIAELRERLGAELLERTALFNDDFSLQRWVSGWDSQWKEIVPRFTKASEVLRCMGVDGMDLEDPDDVNDFLRKQFVACEFFTGGLMGYDKNGNLVILQCVGKIHTRTLIHCGRVSDVYKLSILEAALTLKLIKAQEKKLNRKLGVVVILDLEGLSMDHIYAPAIKSYMNLLRTLQDMFPDMAEKVFVINAPAMFASAYHLVKPAIAEKSRQKVRILTASTYREVLCRELGADCVYSHWGGTKKATKGSPTTGTLRMGGKPPDYLRYQPANNPHHVTDDRLQKLNVPARSRRAVKIITEQPNQRIRWFFQTNSDIDFRVEREVDSQLIVPNWRLTTDFVPEFNECLCVEAGEHSLIFDNSFSTFFSKEIKYHIEVVGDDDTKS